MTFQDQLNAAQSQLQQENILNSFIQFYIDTKVEDLKTLVLGGAPETLDTLKELADAISGDPEFFTTMSTANTALQTAIDAVQADVDQNETDADAAIAAEATARGVAVTGEATTRQAAIDAVNTLITTLQNEAAARLARIEALEVDPTTATAVAAVQADVDQNEADGDAADTALSGRLDVLEADPTTATAVAAVQADVDQNEADGDAADAALSGRLDVLEADPTTKTYVDAQVSGLVDAAPGALDTLNELAAALGDDANFSTTVTNLVAAVQLDVDQNETDSDAADAALSGRLDTLEADPTTATAVAAVQSDVDQNEADGDAADAALSGRLDTLEADPTTQTAVDAKLNTANPSATGQLTVDTNARVQFDSNLTKVENVLRGTGINIGNNIELVPAAAGGHVEITGDLVLDASDITNAADDTAAAAAGVIVGQLYRNGSQLMVRVA